MSDIVIEIADPRAPAVTALIGESHAFLQSLYSRDACHYLDISALCAPNIRFFAARRGSDYVGCCALSNKGDYGEIKSLFVRPSARGHNLGARLLETVELEARQQKITSLKLETGDKLSSALRLYRGSGYQDCGPFGDYIAVPTSVFMSKELG